MKTYSKYINNEDHNWYDSSNIIYSVYFDDQKDGNKSMKIVFKGGRSYLYKDVDPLEYTLFRDGQSQGKIFNETIKKRECVKLPDTNLNELDELKQSFMKSDNPTEFNLKIIMNENTGEFHLYLNENKVFESVEGNVSILNLLKSLGLEYTYELSDINNQSMEGFETKNIIN